MEKSLILSALHQGIMHLEGQFIYGSNYTFMVTCQHNGESFKAVYKPMRGEQPLWDFPHQTLAKREVAAFLVSEALGWNLVPPTVFREEKAPMGPGSTQIFIEHNPEYHYFNFVEAHRKYLPEVMLFDLLINNADRKGGHLIVDVEGKLWVIDHGLTFHQEDKLRTVIWDLSGESIPTGLLSDIKTLLPQIQPGAALRHALESLLLPAEITALQNRTQQLLANGIFPLPPEDRRAYPWPLV